MVTVREHENRFLVAWDYLVNDCSEAKDLLQYDMSSLEKKSQRHILRAEVWIEDAVKAGAPSALAWLGSVMEAADDPVTQKHGRVLLRASERARRELELPDCPAPEPLDLMSEKDMDSLIGYVHTALDAQPTRQSVCG